MKIPKKLTQDLINSAKPKKHIYDLYDGDGLFLRVYKSGKKTFFYRYKQKNTRITKKIATIDMIDIKKARNLVQNIKNEIKKGFNIKIVSSSNHNINFSKNIFFNDLVDLFNKKQKIESKSKERNKNMLQKHIFKSVDKIGLNYIDAEDIKKAIIRIDNDGKSETAKRVFSLVSRIFDFAVTFNYMKKNPIKDIEVSFLVSKTSKTNFNHTTNPKELAKILNNIDKLESSIVVKYALKILPYLIVRPTNLRKMKWIDIDIDKKTWEIKANEMKTKHDHIVPLCQTAINIINKMKEINKNSDFVFSMNSYHNKIMSENTLNKALKKLNEDFGCALVSPHGFRHTAKTILSENSYKHDFLRDKYQEEQLSHNKIGIRQVYNKAKYIEARFLLMDWWGGFLDDLKK